MHLSLGKISRAVRRSFVVLNAFGQHFDDHLICCKFFTSGSPLRIRWLEIHLMTWESGYPIPQVFFAFDSTHFYSGNAGMPCVYTWEHQLPPTQKKKFFRAEWRHLYVRPRAFFRVLCIIAVFKVSKQLIVDCSGKLFILKSNLKTFQACLYEVCTTFRTNRKL